MKSLQLIVLGALVSQLVASTAVGQVPTARQLTRKVVPQPPQTNTPARPPIPAQGARGPAAPTAHPAPAVAPRPTPPPAAVRVVTPPVDPEKARAAREESVRKTVEFQKKRAAEGSESAQYELGVRYLKGDGVAKDEAEGRRWLGLSAKGGYGPASKKLEDLDKAGAAPAPAPAK